MSNNEKQEKEMLVKFYTDVDMFFGRIDYIKETLKKPMIAYSEKENIYLYILYTKTYIMKIFRTYPMFILKNYLKEYDTLLHYYNIFSTSKNVYDTFGICYPNDFYNDFANFPTLDTEDVSVNYFSQIIRETFNKYYSLQIKGRMLDIEITKDRYLSLYYEFLGKLSKISNQEQVYKDYYKSLSSYDIAACAPIIQKYFGKCEQEREIRKEKMQQALKIIGKIAFVCFVIFSILLILFLSSYQK